MAPLNEDQLKNIRDERKIQIMNAAIKVFAENGVKLTKISMIAKEAGISHGLLYHYFKSKEEVLYESLEWAMEMSSVMELFQHIEEMQLTSLGKITFFTKFAFTEGNSDIFRIIQHLSKLEDVPDHTKNLIEKSSSVYIELFLPLIVKGQEEGEIIQGDPQELLELYLTTISGIMADDLAWWNENVDRRVGILLRMIATR